jgi:hypothetical protein
MASKALTQLYCNAIGDAIQKVHDEHPESDLIDMIGGMLSMLAYHLGGIADNEVLDEIYQDIGKELQARIVTIKKRKGHPVRVMVDPKLQ